MTWFLSALLQLTAIAPIFIITYYKKPMIGIYLLLSAIVFSLFAAILPYIAFGVRPYLQIWELETVIFSNSKSLAYYHTTPNVYLVSFLVGIGFGFVLARTKKLQFTGIQSLIIWCLSFVSII